MDSINTVKSLQVSTIHKCYDQKTTNHIYILINLLSLFNLEWTINKKIWLEFQTLGLHTHLLFLLRRRPKYWWRTMIRVSEWEGANPKPSSARQKQNVMLTKNKTTTLQNNKDKHSVHKIKHVQNGKLNIKDITWLILMEKMCNI